MDHADVTDFPDRLLEPLMKSPPSSGPVRHGASTCLGESLGPGKIEIVASSARWLAASCMRAGIQPRAWDYFGDADLAALCPVRAVAGMAEALDQIADDPWGEGILAGGGFESLLIESAWNARKPAVPLLNMPVDAALLLRDPVWWTQRLREEGLDAPDCRMSPPELADSETWLVKPLAGGGGRGIQRLGRERPFPSGEMPRRVFYQEFRGGDPVSAIVIGDGRSARVLSVFEQWIGDRRFGASSPFQYCGNAGPIFLPAPAQTQLQKIVDAVVPASGASGLLGIDLVLDGERLVPVEFNPRPTASCELLERWTGHSVIPAHLTALSGDGLPGWAATAQTGRGALGKAIVCVPPGQALAIDRELHGVLMERARAGSAADIPRPDSVHPPGAPLLTLFGSGSSPSGVRENLREEAARLLRQLRPLEV